jgi:hypothetical protein
MFNNTTSFSVEVAVAILLRDSSNQMKCGFLTSTDNKLCLPNQVISHNNYISKVAIQLLCEYLKIDLRTIDIIPVGFFDDKSADINNRVLLVYKTIILPGTPVHSDITFMDNESVTTAHHRISRLHYAAYNTAIR